MGCPVIPPPNGRFGSIADIKRWLPDQGKSGHRWELTVPL